jgi:type I restriction enzyme S subunit
MGDEGRAESLANYKVCEAGDLVLNRMSAYNGALGVARARGLVSPDYLVMVPAEGVDPDFMALWLKTPLGVGEMTRRLRGIGSPDAAQVRTPRINHKDLRDIMLPLPAVVDQRAIIAYLDRETAQIDALIKKQRQLIETLRERRAAVVEARISGPQFLDGSRLKHYVIGVRQGWSPQCYPWRGDGVETWAVLKAGAANWGRFRSHENKMLPEDEKPRPETVVLRGQLIVSRANTRELVGSAAVVDDDFPRLMLSDKLYAFTLRPERAVPEYVALALSTRRWRDLIELEAGGTSPSMQNISQADIVNLPMGLPSIDEQHRVVSVVREQAAKIDTLMGKAERFIELAKERRSALITAAVTGQIDVREAA